MEQATPARGWYACYTRPRAEKKVHALFAERGVESYLPLVGRLHHWQDRDRTVLLPLFASYVFARDETVGRIVETPGVRGVVRFAGRPALIPDPEIRNIERFVAALTGTRHEPRPVRFNMGERVCISSGPFQGVEAVVLRGRDRRRVVVGLAAIGAGFELDVPARSLRALE